MEHLENEIATLADRQIKLSAREMELMCRDQTLCSNEDFEPNGFYGNSFIMKAYAGVDQNMSLSAILPHGVCLTYRPWMVEINHRIKLLLCHSEIQALNYQNYKKEKHVIPVGAPYLYASRLVSRYAAHKQTNNRSMIVFPAHSTHHLTAEFNSDQWLDILKEIRRNTEINICLYWRDVQLGRHIKYINEGFDVTTCGHMYDQMFLIRLAVLMHNHSSCVINSLGSCAFYAAVDGLDVSLLPQKIQYSAENDEMKSELNESHDAWHAVAFDQTFTYPWEVKSKKQYEIASAALGKKDMKRSKELRSLLLGDIPDDPGKQLVKAHPVSENKLPLSVLNALNM